MDAARQPGAAPDDILWGGHATVRITLAGTAVLTDPLLRARVMHLRRVVPLVAGLTDDLGAVLISHQHHDHLDLPSLRMIPDRVPIVVPARARGSLGRLAARQVIELAPGQDAQIGPLRICATPAAHDGRRAGRRASGCPAMGYLVESRERCVYFAGDTDLFAGMADLAPRLDCALVPIWGWGPTLGPGHLDPERAARALALLRPRIAVPVHWGTYRPHGIRADRRAFLWTPAERFAAAAAADAPQVDVRIVAPGGRVGLTAPPRAG